MDPATRAHRLRPGFALISVLAMVSLAALTATAFLAAARLEGQATRPISDTLRLQMALSAGRECAYQVLDQVAEPGYGWNFVTTYWRGAGTNGAWQGAGTNPATNDLGYLLMGSANSRNNLRWTYYCGFSTAQFTNFDTNIIGNFVRVTNLVCQASFTNDVAAFMRLATSANWPTNETSTNSNGTCITMLGNQTSPPVGWVYIRQDIRTNPSSTNTASLPVARFAYYIQDLGGLIDAERMGGTANRPTGTNPEEISLANLVVGDIRAPTRIAGPSDLTSYTNKRPQYITPGMMMSNNGGILTNTNDLRYFANRLRYPYWNDTNNWDRIPVVPIRSSRPFYPTNAGWLKVALNTNNRSVRSLTNLAELILTNFPDFTNRAGGMLGTNYVYALAANILNYTDNSQRTFRPPLSFPIPGDTNGMVAIGSGNYPIPTILFDRITGAAGAIQLSSYWQFWNCCNLTSPPVSFAFVYDFADTLNSASNRITPNPITNVIAIPALPPGAAFVTNPINQTFAGLAGTSTWIDGTTSGQNTTNNKLRIYKTNDTSAGALVPSNIIFQMLTGFERKAKNVQGTPGWSGGMPGLRYDNVAGINTSFKVPPSGDPRMVNYFTNNRGTGYLSACDYDQNVEWQLGFAQTRKDAFNGNPYSGFPGNWVDGANSTNNGGTGTPYRDTTPPQLGVFSNVGSVDTFPSLPRLSTNSFFTNICELGNVFDPVQWVSTTITAPSQWVDCDISPGTTWSGNSMYGGGQTLRIGRPEHSRFAFTNIGGNSPVPSLGTSAAGLLDLLTLTNTADWSGKININTAPPAVLASLAGGIVLQQTAGARGNVWNTNFVNQFTNGVIRFRTTYPFVTPSQLAFISANYGATNSTGNPLWTNATIWSNNAVFGTNIFLTPTNGGSSLSDAGREELFSKIYNLTTVQSFNFRVYVVAQLLNTNGTPRGAMSRKYYQIYLRNNSPESNNVPNRRHPYDGYTPSVSRVPTYEAFY